MQAERKFLEWVRAAAAGAPARARGGVRLGIGDDAALLRPRAGHEVVVTTDLMVEDVHFLRHRDRAPEVGHRLATRALSDLAAMGAEPLALFVSCALPPQLPTAWARGFFRGLLGAATAAGAQLAGGDLAVSAPRGAHGGKIMLDVTGVGQVPAGGALRRSGARVGDHIFVSGVLGLAARGRQLVHCGRRPANAPQRLAVAQHRQPRARWELGRALRGIASAALDVSDGLSVDLAHLCAASAVGAEVVTAHIPRAAEPGALDLALHGGEDYELLFCVPPRRVARLTALRPGCPFTDIGRITAHHGVRLLDATGGAVRLPPRGWQHFRN